MTLMIPGPTYVDDVDDVDDANDGNARVSTPVPAPVRTHADLAPLIPLAAIAFLLAGGALWALPGLTPLAPFLWRTGLVLTGVPVGWRTLRRVLHGEFATDVVALLAITGALLLDQPLAGLVVVLMISGGEMLERYAAGRASSALRALEAAAPRLAHVHRGNDFVDASATDVAVGETLLVRPGELVPCDGVVQEGRSHVDTSSLTGEPVARLAAVGAELMSGSINGEGALVIIATARAEESQYARIVDLVRQAQESRAPLQRLADRYAVWFTPATLVVALAAYLMSGDLVRVLAVLVVATPCPLLLAAPVAMISGINRAARLHIIVRSGAALEALGTVNVAVLDKTGTITLGRPAVDRVIPANGFTSQAVLEFAAPVEQRSGHLLARSVVDAARDAGVLPTAARDVEESPGRGVGGMVNGRHVLVGARSFVQERCEQGVPAELAPNARDDDLRAFVAVDGRFAGAIIFGDQVRPEAAAFFVALDALGIERRIMLSGDRASAVASVAALIGITEVMGDLRPGEKLDVVKRLVAEGNRVLVVGDGTNDAPALAQATVGVALAGHGGGVTAEAADVVVLTDDLSRVSDAINIGRRTISIARQSIIAGLVLSGVAMVAASAGLIAPAFGAMLQEGIDVAVILNALRASR